MRVGIDAHTVGRQQTGNERFTLELASALAARDDVDVVCYLDRGTSWPTNSPAPSVKHLRAHRPQLRIPFELPFRARRDKLDLLQVAYVAPPFSTVPLVTVVHDLSFEDHPALYPTRTRMRLQSTVRRSVAKSAAVVTGSEFTRGRLIDVYGLPPEKVHRVAYGVGEGWRPMDRPDADRVLAGVDLPPRFVLAVGTSAPRKNLARLIEAVALLRATSDKDLGLVLAGPAINAQTDNWIYRLGFVTDEQLRALYSTANVVAYVSLYEGFGLPVLEALASRAVLVASNTSAVAEVGGEACIRVDPSSVESIAGGLASALTDTQLRARLLDRAVTSAAPYTWTRCAEEMVRVYRVALNGR